MNPVERVDFYFLAMTMLINRANKIVSQQTIIRTICIGIKELKKKKVYALQLIGSLEPGEILTYLDNHL